MTQQNLFNDPVTLPGVLAEIASVADSEAALRIAQVCGGGRAYFPMPRSLSDDHWLVRCVGRDHAVAIAQLLGGCETEVPLGLAAGNRAEVWGNIQKYLEQGLSVDQVARLVGVSSRTVRRHKSSLRQ